MAPPRSPRPRRSPATLLGGTALAALLPLALAAPASAAAAPAPRPGPPHSTGAASGAATGALPGALPGAVAEAAGRPGVAAAPAAAARPAVAPLCSSATHPALAARLTGDLTAALRGRTDTVALTVRDPLSGVSCALDASRHFDSASVVKATVMAAVLRRAQEQRRDLSGWETADLRAMITHSDNDAASALWADLGRARLTAFLALAGMTATVPGDDGYWGLTQITATDEMRLLDVLTDRQDVLSARWKAYALGLMAAVVPEQRWGAPFGAPAGVTAHNKNGWLPRASRGWRVHSLGILTGPGRDYRMAVLTDDNRSMGYGVETVQRVALAVNRDVGGSRSRG
jgi:Beta-lactamase enzyme family